MDLEAGLDAYDGVIDEVDAVGGDLAPSHSKELYWRHAVAGQVPLHVGGGGVSWRTGVDDGDTAPGPAEDQGCAQPGGASADNHHVVLGWVHVNQLDVRCAPMRIG